MDFFDAVGSLALGSRLKRLSDMFMAEGRTVYRTAGVDFEPRWFPVFFILQQRGSLTVTEAAAELGVPHTYVSQLLKELRQAKLVSFKRHPEDGRSRLVVLTAEGRALGAVLTPLWNDIRAAIDTVIDATHIDVLGTLRRIEQLVAEMPPSSIVEARRRARTTGAAELPTAPQRAFYLRPIERHDNPAMAAIIRSVMTSMGACGPGFSINDAEVDQMYEAYTVPGARYVVAVYDGTVVGGAGIAPLLGGDPSTCELRKMYLLPEVRGLGVGRALLTQCLEAACDMGYTQCYIETLASMTTAQQMYERSGFTRIPGALGATGHFSCDVFYVKSLMPTRGRV